jgi:LacI family transcriptional regulator
VSRLARRPGPVCVAVGSHRYLGREACEMSFRAYLREHAPGFTVLDTLVNLEDPQVAHEMTLALLQRHPDLVGLYDAGGGGMAGTLRALRAERPPGHPQGHVVVVANGLTADHRTAMADGVVDVVLDTPPAPIALQVVQAMLAVLRQPPAERASAAQWILPLHLYTAENL